MDTKGFRNAKLVLGEPRGIYYSGQVLYGHIECELTQTVNFTAINMSFRGAAKVHWTETDVEEYNGNRRVVEVGYNASEEYFNFTQCVRGGRGVEQLHPGTHRVPFQFQIPHHAPSTFSGEKGNISYCAAAYIEYADPGMERDVLEKVFEVVAPLDLNKVGGDIKQPLSCEFEELYSCCCSSNPINITISLPQSGYCPGQAIPITVKAQNDTNVEVKKIIFQLIQKECYHSNEPNSEYIPPGEILGQMASGPILANRKRESTYDLVVPDMIAPNLQNCNIIDVGFFLKVIIKVSGCNDDLEDESELAIGLVPVSQPGVEYIHPMKDSLPNAPIPVDIPAQTAAYNNTNTTTYPNSMSPYPNPMSSHPNTMSPYPNPMSSNPNTMSPYPNPIPSHPNTMSPYPNQMSSHPNTMSPYPNPMSSHPNTMSPYPNSTEIPMANLPINKIGFMMPGPGGHQPQFPLPIVTPYPGGNMSDSQNYPPPYSSVSAPSAPPPSS